MKTTLVVLLFLLLGCGSEQKDILKPPPVVSTVDVETKDGQRLGGVAILTINCQESPPRVSFAVVANLEKDKQGRWQHLRGEPNEVWGGGVKFASFQEVFSTDPQTINVSDSMPTQLKQTLAYSVRFLPAPQIVASSGTATIKRGAQASFEADFAVVPEQASAKVSGIFFLECKVPASALGGPPSSQNSEGAEVLVEDKKLETPCCAQFAGLL